MKKKLNCVLLIDDDEPTNFFSRMIIEEGDYAEHIQTADGGQAALDYLTCSELIAADNHEFPCPDLIFLDINMPAMNGWEFLERYDKLEPKHKGKVVTVMLTTSLNPDDRLKAKAAPSISGFESKPLTKEKLHSIVRKYFPENFK